MNERIFDPLRIHEEHEVTQRPSSHHNLTNPINPGSDQSLPPLFHHPLRH